MAIKKMVKPIWVLRSVAAIIGRAAAKKGVKIQCIIQSVDAAIPVLSQRLEAVGLATILYISSSPLTYKSIT